MVEQQERLSNPLQESYEVNKYGRVHRSVFVALMRAGHTEWGTIEKALDALYHARLLQNRLRIHCDLACDEIEQLHALIAPGVMFD